MTTPEQPNTPPLTRRQLREIRNTGATTIVGVGVGVAPESEVEEDTFVVERHADAAPAERPTASPDWLAKPASPVVVPPAPAPDASVDLGVSPLTRRQARQQERIRTASVPVITPDLAAQFAAQKAFADTDLPSTADVDEVQEEQAVLAEIEAEVDGQPVPAVVEAEVTGEQPVPAEAQTALTEEEPVALIATKETEDEASEDRPVVNAELGAELLAGDSTRAELPPTFDQLISREASTAGSAATPNALILSQTPTAGPLTGPIASTGEVLITGSYDLPEGLGSTGHAPGVADGKEADAVLVDGELPAHSSPTPISASAAISTVKTEGEIIRPPAPEKGNKLMLTLAITAGALALALVGVLILAFVTGVFS